MKRFFFKYMVIILIMISIIGIYFYESTRGKKQKKSVQEYTIQNMGVNKLDNLRLSIINLDTIDPINSINQNVQDIANLIFEPLLEIDEKYQTQLGLAKEWAKLNDKEYVITLKDEIVWHNGEKFQAKDVKATIDQIKEKEESVYYANVEPIQDVIVIDDSTIKIRLDREIPFFEYQLTFPIIWSGDDEWIGTGKYKIVEHTDQSILLEEWDKWWKKEEEEDSIIKKIEIYLYHSTGEAYQAFKEGQTDLLVTSNLEIEKYIGSMGFYSKQFPDRQYDFITCNIENSILEKKEVRQAIYYAINKQDIIKNIYQGKYQEANFPLYHGSYLAIEQEEEDQPEKAREVLEEAGWQQEDGIWQLYQKDTNISLKLNLTVCDQDEQRVKVAEMIKQDLEEIGIPVDLNLVSLNQYEQCIQKKQYELLLVGMQTTVSPDLTSYLGKDNLSNFYNEEITDILSEVTNMVDENMLKQKYKRILEILQEEKPYIGLYFHTRTILYQKNLMGNMNPTAYQIFYHINTWYRQD